MPWIEVIDEEDADGKLRECYDKAMGKRGKLSNIMKIHSLLPETMTSHLDLYMKVMFNHSGLSRQEREMVAVVVSAANNCKYCTSHHTEALEFYWKDKTKVEQLGEDFRKMALEPRQQALVEYAHKLTLTPEQVSKGDVLILKEQGLSDEEVLNLALVVGYFNFVNRIILGLGVEFSAEEIEGYKY